MAVIYIALITDVSSSSWMRFPFLSYYSFVPNCMEVILQILEKKPFKFI